MAGERRRRAIAKCRQVIPLSFGRTWRRERQDSMVFDRHILPAEGVLVAASKLRAMGAEGLPTIEGYY